MAPPWFDGALRFAVAQVFLQGMSRVPGDDLGLVGRAVVMLAAAAVASLALFTQPLGPSAAPEAGEAPAGPRRSFLGALEWVAVGGAGRWVGVVGLGCFLGFLAALGPFVSTARPAEHWRRAQIIATWPLDRVHVLLGAVWLVGALTQLAGPVRQRWPRAHRWVGRLVVGSAVASCFAVVLMALLLGSASQFRDPYRGVAPALSSGLCLFAGLRARRAKDVVAHRAWMLRSLVGVVGIVLLRVELGALAVVPWRLPVWVFRSLDWEAVRLPASWAGVEAVVALRPSPRWSSVPRALQAAVALAVLAVAAAGGACAFLAARGEVRGHGLTPAEVFQQQRYLE